MEVNYKNAESLVKPSEIDISSSEDGVYIHRDIKEITKTDEQGNVIVKYSYQEAFLTKDEYEAYSNALVAGKVNGDENSSAFENYKTKLDTAIVYPVNGHLYKAKWAEGTYAGLLQKGALLPSIFPLKIYDATELEENAEDMTMEELVTLTIFLASKQEEYFQEYKAEKTA